MKAKIVIIVLSVALAVSIGFSSYVLYCNYGFDKALFDARLDADNLEVENGRLKSDVKYYQSEILKYQDAIRGYETAMKQAQEYINQMSAAPAMTTTPEITPEEFLKALIRIIAL